MGKPYQDKINFSKDAASACIRLLNASSAHVINPSPFPAGIRYRRRNINSVRVSVEGKTLIATRRNNPLFARTEAMVLSKLQNGKAPVPRLIAFDQIWMLQEDVGRINLPTALANADNAEGEELLDKALGAIVDIQKAGTHAGLATRLRQMATEEIFFNSPATVGRLLGLPPPELKAGVRNCLNAGLLGKFIKGDARPGNAIVTPDRRIVWVDWEHAGCGNPLSDLEWMIADEWIPDWPDTEMRLIEKYHGAFGNENTGELDYLWVLGTLHMLARLSAILKYKGNGPWWDSKVCLKHELFGVTYQCATRLSVRAARWAGRSPNTKNLVAWLQDLTSCIPDK